MYSDAGSEYSYMVTIGANTSMMNRYGEFAFNDGVICPFVPIYKNYRGVLGPSEIAKYLKPTKDQIDAFHFKLMLI